MKKEQLEQIAAGWMQRLGEAMKETCPPGHAFVFIVAPTAYMGQVNVQANLSTENTAYLCELTSTNLKATLSPSADSVNGESHNPPPDVSLLPPPESSQGSCNNQQN